MGQIFGSYCGFSYERDISADVSEGDSNALKN